MIYDSSRQFARKTRRLPLIAEKNQTCCLLDFQETPQNRNWTTSPPYQAPSSHPPFVSTACAPRGDVLREGPKDQGSGWCCSTTIRALES